MARPTLLRQRQLRRSVSQTRVSQLSLSHEAPVQNSSSAIRLEIPRPQRMLIGPPLWMARSLVLLLSQYPTPSAVTASIRRCDRGVIGTRRTSARR
jgi:hypothetical protein